MAELDALTVDFASRHPGAFARVAARGRPDEVAAVLAALPTGRAAAIVGRLPAARIQGLVEADPDNAVRWLADAPVDDAVKLLSRLPRERRMALIEAVPDARRRLRFQRHESYPAHSVGSLVSGVTVMVEAGALAADAAAAVRAIEADDPGPVVVVDADNRYVGMVDLWRLLTRGDGPGKITEFTLAVEPLHPETSLAAAARDTGWHRHQWMPVVDHRRRLLGAVSRRAIFEGHAATTRQSPTTGDLFFDLLRELGNWLGTVLEGALGARRKA